MRVKVLLVLTVFTVGLVDAARRRVRSTTVTAVTTMMTTPPSFIGRQLGFVEQPEELETLWDNYDIQKLDSRAESWSNLSNASEKHDEIVLNTGRQLYPGLPANPGETNELPRPISPQPVPPPQQPAPGCLGLRGQYPSPKSCANYLNCWDDVVIEQTCPAGLLFNDVTNVCDFDYNVNCGNRPLPTPKPPLSPGSKLCPDQYGRYRVLTNCSEFYVCVTGRPIKFSCPRSLVYNDILNVCDYPWKVDCKGSATPKPQPPQPSTQPPPTQPRPTQPPQTSSKPPPTHPPKPPTYPSPQPPIYPQPQPYPPPPPSSYPGNPWLSKVEPDPWNQRPSASQIEIDSERLKQEELFNGQVLGNQPQAVTETSSLVNPWTLFQVVPPELMKTPCKNGDVHRLNEACTNMVVCRNERPQMVRCLSGFSYDIPSDSCRPFSVAKC